MTSRRSLSRMRSISLRGCCARCPSSSAAAAAAAARRAFASASSDSSWASASRRRSSCSAGVRMGDFCRGRGQGKGQRQALSVQWSLRHAHAPPENTRKHRHRHHRQPRPLQATVSHLHHSIHLGLAQHQVSTPAGRGLGCPSGRGGGAAAGGGATGGAFLAWGQRLGGLGRAAAKQRLVHVTVLGHYLGVPAEGRGWGLRPESGAPGGGGWAPPTGPLLPAAGRAGARLGGGHSASPTVLVGLTSPHFACGELFRAFVVNRIGACQPGCRGWPGVGLATEVRIAGRN